MAGFLYYLPGETRKLTHEELDEVGLIYAFDRNPTSNGCRGGPDGKSGMVLAGGDTKVGYYPDQQTWRRIPGNKADAWVGMYSESPPKPDDLIHSMPLPGHLVELGDGGKWLCPIARGLREEDDQLRWYNALPQETDVDDDGNWTQGGIVAQHARLWEVAIAWWDSLRTATWSTDSEPTEEDGEPSHRISFEFAGLNDASLLALATNYRVGKAEVALLHLFRGQCASMVLGALVDLPTLIERAKKNAESLAVGSNTDAGQVVDTPVTDQP